MMISATAVNFTFVFFEMCNDALVAHQFAKINLNWSVCYTSMHCRSVSEIPCAD